ncbi:hypothetical protein BOTBODRAFT_113351 [Botryobasidium botryosum FD-172 SS1]|uniref:DUF6589 domain-containing protein n=1 Tax=Botryobasidium botryosum (strain FD-172 SS1) TaxID=930990 RepID=A0A067MJV9_BOTB1|nr:hypothetical protein BOTBODRAFT_113351 [Botryobasidium botryosum FD-172 SS1]
MHVSDIKTRFGPRHTPPVAIKQIPVTKTTQIPARALNINVGTNSGNGAALESFAQQGGITESELEEYVLVTHGDLGTGEKINNLKTSRAIEEAPLPDSNRMTHVVFVPGMFHSKMHGADAVWRIHIERMKPKARAAPLKDSVFAFCAHLRPKETAKIASKPGFRMQHTLINNVLAASILQCWKKEVEARYGYTSVEDWVKSDPTNDDFIAVSEAVVRTYVAPLAAPKSRPEVEGDAVKDTMLLFNRDALLYAMTSHAANTGDVGRVEQLLIFWVYIWKGIGKHKYAAYISKFLLDLHEGWPPRLARAIRLNWFVNPTGKPDGFRGVDWVIERNNLRHKHTYSGQGPNRTMKFIIKQSPLIDLYQSTHQLIEQGFSLTGRTLKHPPPLMKKTLERLRSYMEDRQVHTFKPGRKLGKERAIDAIRAGMGAMLLLQGADAVTGYDEAEIDGGDIGVDE